MNVQTLAGIHTSATLPVYRRGIQPKAMGYVRVTYKPVTVDRAESAWRGLLAGAGDSRALQKSAVIAAAMGVSNSRAGDFRRLFEMLGLTTDIPGEWIGPGLWDENIPARVIVEQDHPEALAVALQPYGEVLRLYVVSRRVEPSLRAVSRLGDNSEVPGRFAPGVGAVVRPAPFWWAKRPTIEGLPDFLTEQGEPFVSPAGDPGSLLVSMFSPWGDTNPPPGLVVASRHRPTEPPSGEARPSCLPTADEPLSVPDLMIRTGWARKTVYRHLEKWEGAGAAERVSRGRYRLAHHVIAQITASITETRQETHR